MLKGNIVFNSITLSIAVLGIILTFIFYLKSVKKKNPVYILRTFSLITENVKKVPLISIKHCDKNISNLSITRIAFWNSGKETIDKNDIARKSPIKFAIDEKHEILDAEILYCKNPSNDFKINANKKEVIIKFDYFDNEEGIILQIYHTGNSNKNFSVSGSIKSVNEIINIKEASYIENKMLWLIEKFDINKVRRFMRKAYAIHLIIFSILLPIAYVSQYIPAIKKFASDEFSFVFFTFIVFFSFLFLNVGIRKLKKPTPKGFEIFYDEI
jgi:hypothetical protein